MSIMILTKKYFQAFVALVFFSLISCDKQGSFKVDGTVEGADNATLMVQNSIHGRWITIDSVKTDSKGEFSYKRLSPEFPEIYRLVLDKAEIYVPIDSVDHITVSAIKNDNGTVSYTLSGSDDATSMNSIDALATEMASATTERRAEIKKELSKMLLANPAGNAAYYLLNKQVQGKAIFDLSNPSDVRLYGAIANAYSGKRPNDPRTPLIVTTYLNNRALNPYTVSARDTIEATEARIIEVNLPDELGNAQSLSEITSHGKVVVLNFTVYAADESPAFNKMLSDLYNKYKDRGFEIYQVALDPNVASWKLAAQNLPWITVYDESGEKSRNVLNYNVGIVPLSFIIDRSGEVVARVVDQSKLESEIKKQL